MYSVIIIIFIFMVVNNLQRIININNFINDFKNIDDIDLESIVKEKKDIKILLCFDLDLKEQQEDIFRFYNNKNINKNILKVVLNNKTLVKKNISSFFINNKINYFPALVTFKDSKVCDIKSIF